MLITTNGTIEGLPYTAIKKQGSVWQHLLICRVSLEVDDDALTELFNTKTVQDYVVGITWHNTCFEKITADEYFKYVWLTYAAQVVVVEQYEEALNILGVQTDESGDSDAV